MSKRTAKLNGARNGHAVQIVDEPLRQPRAYTQLIEQLKKISPDWRPNRIGVDAELYRNHWELRAFSRNLWRENPFIMGYGQELAANVIGPTGYTLRMMVKETEDRIIYSEEEKDVLERAEARRNDVLRFTAAKSGAKFKAEKLLHKIKGQSSVKVGNLDTFANQLIEKKWAEWQLRENCTVTGRISYNESRQLRLKSCARDGDHFIRLIRDSRYEPFGFKIQHINAEWCNYYLNGYNEKNQNPIRYGIEYDESYAAPVPVAYWFTKATSGQWATMSPVNFGTNNTENSVRIPAEDIIHYGKFDDDADVTRPVPWATPVMSSVRQLDKAMEAVVVAMRVGACSNVFFETDLIGPDGTTAAGADPEIMKGLSMEMNPGGAHGLPPGVRAKEFNPNQPNPNTGHVRNEILRSICAGLPGAQFSTIGQNYAEINFSAGRLERLTITAQWTVLQEFDIAIAERRIFSEWLKMALLMQAVPLPVEKHFKFNAPKFTGKRWPGVDPIKDANAKALDLANKFTSPQRIHDEQGTDLEQTCIEIQEASMIYQQYGIESDTTKGPIDAETEIETEDGSETVTTENEQGMETKELTEILGVAVRAGVVTPSLEVEAAMRAKLELPEMSADVVAAWTADGGVRRPITLSSIKGGESETAETIDGGEDSDAA